MQEEGLTSEPPATAPAPSAPGGARVLLLAAACLSLVLALFFRDSLFGDKVLAQADALYQFQPWKSVAPEGHVPSNEVLLDQSIVMLPWLRFCADRVQQGELPLWNPHNYCGQPMVGTYQSAIWWPPSWIYFLWPSWSWFAWSAFARLLAAGLATFAFLRRLRLGAGPALVGALGFALCGFMIAWLNHMHATVAIFLPALFWAVERVAARPRWREASLFGLFVGLNLLAGHVQTSLHVLLAVAVWILFRSRVAVAGARLELRGLGRLAACGALGLLLSMPQVLPFLSYLERSQGAVVLETFDQVEREGVKSAPVLMVDPDHYGSPATADYTGPHGHNLNYNELIGGYVGRLILLLALLQAVWLRRRPGTAFFVGLALVAGLVAWQVFPFYDLARAVPRLRSTKLMRLLVLVAFALCTLGAMGLEGLCRRFSLAGARRAALCAAAFVVAAVELVSFGRGYNPEVDPELLVPDTPVTDFLQSRGEWGRTLGVDNTILLPSANLFYGIDMVAGYDSVEFRWMTELVARMSSHPGGELFVKEIPYFDRGIGIADLLGVRWLLSEDALPDALGLQLVLDGPVKVYRNPDALPHAFLSADWVLEPDPARRLARLGADDFDPRQVVLEEPPPRAVEPSREAPGVVAFKRDEPLAIDLVARVRRPCWLVLTDVWDADWEARSGDLKEPARGDLLHVARVDHALRGIWLEPGEHQIALRYTPRPQRVGLLAAAVALVGLLLAALLGGRDGPSDGPSIVSPRDPSYASSS